MADGTWLALLTAGTLAVAGAARGSRSVHRLHRQLDKLTDAQLAEVGAAHRARSVAQQERLVAQLQRAGLDPFDYEWTDVIGEETRRREAWLRTTLGGDVGLNADWSVSAWAIDPHDPRQGYRGHRYVVDNEDGTYSIVRRHSPYEQGDENDVIEDMVTFPQERFEQLQRWVLQILADRRQQRSRRR